MYVPEDNKFGGLVRETPSTELITTNESVLIAFAFTRAILALIVLGSVALRGLDTESTSRLILTFGFTLVAALGFLSAARTLANHYRGRSVFMQRPWAMILLDSALAIGVMTVIDAETSPLAWVALIAPVLETAVLFSMVPAGLVWIGLSLAFLSLRLTFGVNEDPGVETLTLAVQQVLAVLLISGPAALLSDGAQQRIDNLSDARRSADQISDRLRRIAQAASDMSKENSVESVLSSVSHSAVTIGFEHADVVLVEADGSLVSHGSHSSGPFSLPPLELLTENASETTVSTITATDEAFGQILHTHDLASGHAIKISSPGPKQAVLRVWSKRRPSTEPELRALGLLAGHAREIYHAATLLEDAKAHSDRLLHEVRHDGLTGLANRDFVLSTLEGRISEDEQTAIYFIDLDGFKQINDTLGHRAGDTALVTVADRLKAVSRPGAVAGRMGGDEFIIVLPITVFDTAAGLTEFGQLLNDTISQPITVENRPAQLGASVGLAMHSGNLDADQLISLADRAMYAAKRDGGGLKIAGASAEALAELQKAAS